MKRFTCLCAAAMGLMFWIGCGPDPAAMRLAQEERQELDRLRAENRELQRLRGSEEELQRLRRDGQELQQLRAQYQELLRLRRENEELKARLARAQNEQRVVEPVQTVPVMPEGFQEPEVHEPTAEEDEVRPGDEVFVHPQALAVLIPGFDWQALNTTEPIGVKALLEQHGIELTSYRQLRDLGIRNYHVRRADNPPPVP